MAFTAPIFTKLAESSAALGGVCLYRISPISFTKCGMYGYKSIYVLKYWEPLQRFSRISCLLDRLM